MGMVIFLEEGTGILLTFNVSDLVVSNIGGHKLVHK